MTDWKKSSQETVDKAAFVYSIIANIAESSAEAAEIITAIYVRLWMDSHVPNASIDEMLEGLCLCIKTNVEMLESTKQ
jgi:hypothetical protein